MWIHSWFSIVESTLGYESGMMITGFIQQRDGLKGSRGVISSNYNKGRALGPSRLGEWKKGYCAENQVVVTVLVDPNSVTDLHSVHFIYLWETQKYGFMELCMQGVQTSPWMPEILSYKKNSCDLRFMIL